MRVTMFEAVSQPRGGLPVDRVVCGDSLGRSLLTLISRHTGGDGLGRVPLLGRRGHLPVERRRDELAREAYDEAVPHEAADDIDADAVAEWITGHYRAAAYPAVLLGSPHGAVAHLAAALDAAWLPTTFTVALTWPGGSPGDWPGALAWGAGLVERITARNPGVTVRQVHDPLRAGPLCGTTVRLHLRWHDMPPAYERFLRDRVAPGGSSLLLRDLRTWPVTAVSPRHGFQLGSPVGGGEPLDYSAMNPDFTRILGDLGEARWPEPDPDTPLRYAERSGEPALGVELGRLAAETGRASHRALYARPEMLSACVADLVRARDGEAARCVVECGRLLDPWQAAAARFVPYWCESASRSAVEAAEWWLAGSAGFDAVTVLPEAPGHGGEEVATLAHWRSLTSFGRRRAGLDRLAASRYPMLPLSTSHASRVLGEAAEARPALPPMTMEYALKHLQRTGRVLGLLVS